MQFQFLAVGTFKLRGQIALVRQAAAIAKRRLDESHLLPATRTYEPLRRRRPLPAANLADVRVNESHERVGYRGFRGRGGGLIF